MYIERKFCPSSGNMLIQFGSKDGKIFDAVQSTDRDRKNRVPNRRVEERKSQLRKVSEFQRTRSKGFQGRRKANPSERAAASCHQQIFVLPQRNINFVRLYIFTNPKV